MMMMMMMNKKMMMSDSNPHFDTEYSHVRILLCI